MINNNGVSDIKNMSNLSCVPQLRFKGFSGRWETSKLKDKYRYIVTNSLSRSQLNDSSGIVKNIHYGDIHGHLNSQLSLKKQSLPYINLDVDLSKYKQDDYCDTGDLVIADASEDLKDIGKAIEIIDLNEDKILAGLHTIHARPIGNDIYLGFMSYILQTNTNRRQINIIAQGISVLGISKVKLANIDIVIPDKQEQEHIVGFLTTTDKYIEQLTQKIRLLNQYKTGVIQQIFNQEIRFKECNDSDFEDWNSSTLQKIKGFNIKSGNSTSKKDFGRYPFYGSTGLIGFSDNFDNSGNAILIARVGANAGSLYKVNGKYSVSDNTLIVSTSKEFNLNFLFEYLKQYDLRRLVFGTGQPLVTGGMIKKIDIIYPVLAEQEKIADSITAIDEKIDQTHKQLELIKQWKKGLLQQMFV